MRIRLVFCNKRRSSLTASRFRRRSHRDDELLPHIDARDVTGRPPAATAAAAGRALPNAQRRAVATALSVIAVVFRSRTDDAVNALDTCIKEGLAAIDDMQHSWDAQAGIRGINYLNRPTKLYNATYR